MHFASSCKSFAKIFKIFIHSIRGAREPHSGVVSCGTTLDWPARVLLPKNGIRPRKMAIASLKRPILTDYMETIKSHFIILGFGTRPVEHLVRRACFIHFRKRILFENHKKLNLLIPRLRFPMKLFYLQNLLGHFQLYSWLYFRLYFRYAYKPKNNKFVSPKEAVLISVGCFLCLFAADDVIVYKQQPFSVMRFILDSKLLFGDPRTILNGSTRILLHESCPSYDLSYHN